MHSDSFEAFVISLLGVALWAIVPAVIASRKGRSALRYYFLSFLITPLITIIVVCCLKKIEDPNEIETQQKRKVLSTKRAEDQARRRGYDVSLLLLQDSYEYGECPICHVRVRIGTNRCVNCGVLLKPTIDGQIVMPRESDISGFVECPICHNKQVAGADHCFSCNVKFKRAHEEEQSNKNLTEKQNTQAESLQNSRPKVRYCRTCGAQLTGASAFCNSCGTKTLEEI
jgi:hypothetical protein